MVRFVVVPQWQGSGASRRSQIPRGSAAIRAELPGPVVRDVAVPAEAGDPEGSGVTGYSVLRAIRAAHARVLAQTDGPAITIGGDCGVELAAIAHATRRTGGDLAVAGITELTPWSSDPDPSDLAIVRRIVAALGA